MKKKRKRKEKRRRRRRWAPRSGAQRRRRRLSRGAAVSLEFKSALLHLTSKSPLELADSGVPVTGQGPGRPQAAPRAPCARCPRFYIKSDSTLKPLIHDTSKIATPRLVIRVRCRRPRCHGAVSHPRPSARAVAVAAAAATPTADAALVTAGAPVAAELAAASRHDRPSSTRRGATALLESACPSTRTIRGLSRARSSAAAGG